MQRTLSCKLLRVNCVDKKSLVFSLSNKSGNILKNILIQENIKLAPRTYYRIGGVARFFSEPCCNEDLVVLGRFIQNEKLPFFILGAGSNVLFLDEGFSGLVIHTSKLNPFVVQKDAELNCSASILVIQVLRHCMQQGLSGFEFLVGVPGNMGGVLYMNAGTKLGEIKDVVKEITVFNLMSGVQKVFTRDKIQYTYRTQHFLEEGDLILSAKLEGAHSDPKKIQKEIQILLENRKKTQPIDKPSCGSVFKNPDPKKGVFAWKLIESAGLRGHKIGNAQISPLHTNFIVNLGGAKAVDVLSLIELAKEQVYEKFKIVLEEEVKTIKLDPS